MSALYSLEGIRTYLILRVRESNRRQGGAALESVIPRIFALRRFREGGRLKRGAAAESIPPQGSQRSRECDQCQVGATLESTLVYLCQ